ncbi:uncharacterized protein LOC131215280 [Anopheles bellator]|uniref:uncharacterized protein LOC131215280 n=1 Tax=Anopheles bellator TaxID=139047 RepID=UPI00264912DA|nr:uncharacterized protein LOC131215280 [Anopheles bellator]
MGVSARPLGWLLTVVVVVLGSAGVAQATQPALFLTVKSSNFGNTKLDHIESGYLIVTDILISPDGVPLPFFKDNCVYKKRVGLKIIVSFGGSVVPSELFVYLSSDEMRRAAFVDNLVEFTLTNGFHGIDLSWLYPAPQERDQYVRLLRDLRLACDRNGLRLTVTVPSRPSVIEVNYPVEKLAKYADYVILSTTEFRKLRKTSFIAPLYSSSPGSSNNIDYHVDRWKMAGLCSSKIVIVIQTMTLTYKLYIQNEYRVGTPALQLKIRPYYKICRKLYSGSLEIWDASAKSPYAFRDLSWYSYENEKSIKEKVCFVVQQGLGGLAVFYYDEDDPINICGDGQYPLTAIVLAALQTDYQPPAVISEPQIYHFESPAYGGYSNPGPYNGQPYDKKPMVIYVDGSEDTKRPPPQTVPVASDPMAAFTEVLYEPMDNKFIASIVHDGSESDEFGGSSDGDALFFQQPTANGASSYPVVHVELGGRVDAKLQPDDEDSFNILTGMQNALALQQQQQQQQSGFAATAQLYSESGCSGGAMSPPQLFSEQGSPVQPVLYREPRKKCCAVLPPSVTGHFAPPAPEGIRFIATAQVQTPATTTTAATTTTTMAPKFAIPFFANSAVTFRPPSAYCPHPLRFALNGVVSSAPPVTSTAVPPTLPPSHCPMAKLYSEYSPPPQPQPPPPMPGIQFHALAVAGPPAVAFAPYTVSICPADGIVQDPHDRRSYYLCKRGLPMCDENKFNCAHGYYFDVASQKCQREGGA